MSTSGGGALTAEMISQRLREHQRWQRDETERIVEKAIRDVVDLSLEEPADVRAD